MLRHLHHRLSLVMAEYFTRRAGWRVRPGPSSWSRCFRATIRRSTVKRRGWSWGVMAWSTCAVVATTAMCFACCRTGALGPVPASSTRRTMPRRMPTAFSQLPTPTLRTKSRSTHRPSCRQAKSPHPPHHSPGTRLRTHWRGPKA